MLKIARYLFRWSGAPAFMDYYERAILNGLIGTQRMPANYTPHQHAPGDHASHQQAPAVWAPHLRVPADLPGRHRGASVHGPISPELGSGTGNASW
jgi:hypothetical protein